MITRKMMTAKFMTDCDVEKRVAKKSVGSEKISIYYYSKKILIPAGSNSVLITKGTRNPIIFATPSALSIQTIG